MSTYSKKSNRFIEASLQSAENRGKSVTDSGYAYVTQWF